jgi:hypothetical protein
MSFRLDSDQGLILVTVRIDGPIGARYLTLALDTGATSTLINVERLIALGYDPLPRKIARGLRQESA